MKKNPVIGKKAYALFAIYYWKLMRKELMLKQLK